MGGLAGTPDGIHNEYNLICRTRSSQKCVFSQAEGSGHLTQFNVEHSTCGHVSFLIAFWLLNLILVWPDLEPSNGKQSVCDGPAHCVLPKRPEPANCHPAFPPGSRDLCCQLRPYQVPQVDLLGARIN